MEAKGVARPVFVEVEACDGVAGVVDVVEAYPCGCLAPGDAEYFLRSCGEIVELVSVFVVAADNPCAVFVVGFVGVVEQEVSGGVGVGRAYPCAFNGSVLDVPCGGAACPGSVFGGWADMGKCGVIRNDRL